jgi:hypothetical protein
MKKVMMDEVIASRIEHEDGKLYHETTQPTEDIILQRNQDLRNSPGALRDLDFGRQVASIPFIMFEAALRAGYDLNCHDRLLRGKEMDRYLKSEEGKKCLVQAPKRGQH